MIIILGDSSARTLRSYVDTVFVVECFICIKSVFDWVMEKCCPVYVYILVFLHQEVFLMHVHMRSCMMLTERCQCCK